MYIEKLRIIFFLLLALSTSAVSGNTLTEDVLSKKAVLPFSVVELSSVVDIELAPFLKKMANSLLKKQGIQLGHSRLVTTSRDDVGSSLKPKKLEVLNPAWRGTMLLVVLVLVFGVIFFSLRVLARSKQSPLSYQFTSTVEKRTAFFSMGC